MREIAVEIQATCDFRCSVRVLRYSCSLSSSILMLIVGRG